MMLKSLKNGKDWGYKWLYERDSENIQGYGGAEDSGDSDREEGD